MPPAWCHLPGEFSIALKFILKTLFLKKEELGMVIEHYLPSMPEALGFSPQHAYPQCGDKSAVPAFILNYMPNLRPT